MDSPVNSHCHSSKRTAATALVGCCDPEQVAVSASFAKRPMRNKEDATTADDMDLCHSTAQPPQSHPDDVLIQLIRTSGVRTPGQVAEFCRSTGIPYSRMLQLDLLRQIQPPPNNHLKST